MHRGICFFDLIGARGFTWPRGLQNANAILLRVLRSIYRNSSKRNESWVLMAGTDLYLPWSK